MNMRIRLTSLIMILVLVAGPLTMLAACGSSEGSEVYKVYYSNSSNDDIMSMDISMPDYGEGNVNSMVNELFDRMFNRDYTSDHLYSAKPDNVNIRSFTVNSDHILIVDFDSGYLDMTNVQEIILRAAIVLTVIQIEELNGVRFTVENAPITYSDGTEIGTMTADDFVNILLTETGMLKQETDVTLYFTNEEGSSLVPVKSLFVTSNNNTSMEEYIVSQLISGPDSDSGAYPTISANVELISVVSSDDICYVNFGESFLEQDSQPVSDEIMIYSVVNSLCRLTYIDQVQFLIDGEPADKLHTITDLSTPLSRNRSLEASY